MCSLSGAEFDVQSGGEHKGEKLVFRYRGCLDVQASSLWLLFLAIGRVFDLRDFFCSLRSMARNAAKRSVAGIGALMANIATKPPSP